jgi:hypothetical protein
MCACICYESKNGFVDVVHTNDHGPLLILGGASAEDRHDGVYIRQTMTEASKSQYRVW